MLAPRTGCCHGSALVHALSWALCCSRFTRVDTHPVRRQAPGSSRQPACRVCRALGCLLQSCQLCKHNPSRRCAVNFDKKYLVNDVLKAKCQAVIRVEIVERNSNQPIEVSDLREEMILQMAILDGNSYDGKFEAGLESDFESCLLLMNNKARFSRPLLLVLACRSSVLEQPHARTHALARPLARVKQYVVWCCTFTVRAARRGAE